MQELIDQLKQQNKLTDEQAKGVLKTITEFVKEKFPMIGGAVDSLFQTDTGNDSEPEEGAAYIPSAAANSEQARKDKQSGFYEGNKELRIKKAVQLNSFF